jgi:cytochrome P450
MQPNARQSIRITPPAPKVHEKPLPIWRWLPQIYKNPLTIYARPAFEESFLRAKGLRGESIILNDPAGITHVLQINAANYRRTLIQPRLFRPAMGDGLFLAEGQAWRRQRRMLAPVFSPAATTDMIPHFQEAAKLMLARLEGQARVNLAEVFHRSTIDAVLMALFSLPADESRSGLASLVRRYIDGPGKPSPLDTIARSEEEFSWAFPERRKIQKQWAEAVDEIIATRKALGAGKMRPDLAHGRGDLLGLLLSAKDPDTGTGLTDIEIRDQCATFLAAGFETTSRLLFWAAYLLSLDQNEQNAVRAEVQGLAPSQAKSMADTQAWPKLKCALYEALRLYPPAAYIAREAIGDDKIGDEPIKAGTSLWISPWLLHRHKAFWDQPTAFMPERFLGMASPFTSLPAFIPFGAGPRICIGAAFAMTEAQIILGSLLKAYRVTLINRSPVMPVSRITVVPDYEPWFRLEKLV